MESNVIVDGFDVATPGPPPPAGSLEICFCSDRHIIGWLIEWQFIWLTRGCLSTWLFLKLFIITFLYYL